VQRYFDGEPQALWMKRYRCADCGAVHTARPESHWRGFLAPWSLILVCLLRKLKRGRWLSLVSHQRQQYWWGGFCKQASRHSSGQDMAYVLREMIRLPLIAATHSLKYYEITPLHHPPHRIFAVTGVGGYG